MSFSGQALFEIRQTEHAGRGVFAITDIPSGTLLLSSSDLVATFFYRDYLREVCAWCFVYNRGRHWALRDGSAGLAWCSLKCQGQWMDHSGGEMALSAHRSVESLILKKNKQKRKNPQLEPEEEEKPIPPKPTIEDIEIEWQAAEKIGATILAARKAIPPTKAQSRILANLAPPSPEALTHLLAAVLARYTHPDESWADFLALCPSSTPYTSASHLQSHVTAYHHLLTILPIPSPLLSYSTPTILRAIAARDAHNSFGIRSLDDGGDEIFAHGIWPSASYWNHSCAPNVGKRRIGRTWEFTTVRNVKEGDELSITYLGGEEEELDVGERRERLSKTWDFHCACLKCVAESEVLMG